MAYEANDTIKRLFQRFFRDELPNLTPDERAAFEAQFEGRLDDLLTSSASPEPPNFADLIGFGPGPVKPFDQLAYPMLKNDFDQSIIQSQVHAAAELYFHFNLERMKLFEVVGVLRRLFQLGLLRIQRGPGARGLYILEKWRPIRCTKRDRLIAYRRVFNYRGAPVPAGAVVNRNFHYQFVAFCSALSQFFRDYTIGQVIRGASYVDQRPFASVATVQRIGTDLRYGLDRASYGNILALTQEVGQYVQQIFDLLEAPDIKKSFDANTRWDVIEAVSNRYLESAVVAPRQDGRGRAAHPAIRRRQRVQHGDRPQRVPSRCARRRRPGRGVARRLPADARRPQLPRRHRAPALGTRVAVAFHRRRGRRSVTAAQRPQRDAPVLPRVDAPTLNVIIDAHLALAPLGLLRTMRLARTTRVWLPRSLWSLLDNDALYRRHPERLSRRPHGALARMAEQMPMWRQAWHHGRLAANVHWIGDARYEGSAPERGDPGLFQRFEAYRAGLDCAGGLVGDDPLGDCARDAAALAAALQPDPLLILAAGRRR